MDEMSEKVKK